MAHLCCSFYLRCGASDATRRRVIARLKAFADGTLPEVSRGMREIFKADVRKYFRREKGMAYDDRGREIASVWRATSFVEAEIRLGFYADTRALPECDVAIMRDAFREGRFHDVREIAKQHGFSLGFSITGTEGYVLSEREAKREALTHAEEWFGDVEDLAAFNARMGTNFRSEARAARFVIETDGQYAGLDVHAMEYRSIKVRANRAQAFRTRGEERVLITTSCGCIHDTLAECFPEFKPLIPWHLNTMREGPEGRSWVVEELPDEILEAVRMFILSDDEKKARVA